MKKERINRVRIALPAISVNEGTARGMVASIVSTVDPTVEELSDLKHAVSEAVTNAIVHAYGDEGGTVYISVTLYADRGVQIEVRDTGRGIADVEEAKKPLFTTDRSGERSGMGFTVMEAFTDRLRVTSAVGRGTRVLMYKRLKEFHGRKI